MSDLHAHCLACPLATCAGRCTCTRTGRPTTEQAAAGFCPAGRFPTGLSTDVQPLGKVPDGFDGRAHWMLDAGGSPGCGCKG